MNSVLVLSTLIAPFAHAQQSQPMNRFVESGYLYSLDAAMNQVEGQCNRYKTSDFQVEVDVIEISEIRNHDGKRVLSTKVRAICKISSVI